MRTENQKKLQKAIVYAIAEDLVQQLEWSEDLQKMSLPEGVVFHYPPQIIELAKKELNIKS